jgi:hypothetical protein
MKDDSGRVLSVPLNWRGHRLLIINAYVPNEAQRAKQYLLDVVRPVLAETGGRQPVLLGDFNFVSDVSMDRLRTGDTAAARDMARTPSDAACGAVFQREVAPDLVDTFRHMHPARKGMSFFYSGGAARLDRVYVRESFMPTVTSSAIVTIGGAYSDHKAVAVHIMPSAAEVGAASRSRKSRRTRVRMWFWDCGVLRLQFSQWLAGEAALAPADHAALLLWWPDFKRRLAAFVASLNADRRQQALTPAELQDRREAARQALDVAHAALEAGQPGAQQQVVHAQREWAAALREVQQHERVHGKHIDWLHPNERPSPAFTAVVTPPRYATVIQALKHPRGHLVGPSKGQADIMVHHYAMISASQPCDSNAKQSVLEAVRAEGPVGLPQGDVEMLGDLHVSEEEVMRALKRCPPGKSPGLDGIPVELYRRGASALGPLLARVYSAMGQTGQMPRTVLDGLITSLHKAGDRTNPEHYRPITLLNTDYRVLAKVLANRLLRCVGPLISPEQSAFVRGRHIGDGVMLLQLLPQVLARDRHAGAIVAFLDFKKAYDTVSRAFLFDILREFGVGAGFIKWVSLLLSDTRAMATVNGYFSSKVTFGAGVRQGCPLAPLLYLFVAESLLRFLKAQGTLGLMVAGRKIVANQFADDMQVFLRSVREVPLLVQYMHVFRRASGQGMNHGKSSLLPIGPSHPDTPPTPTTVAAIPIKPCATALGFSFASGMTRPSPAIGWDTLLQRVDDKVTTLGRLPLSAFGRAVGASSYALSKLLYHAEFLDPLSDALMADLQKRIAGLVDRNSRPGYTYVPHECLLGAAKSGGFGVLSLQHHLTARRAVWGVRLLCGDDNKPWVTLGRHLLACVWGATPWHVMLPLHAPGQAPAASAHYGGGMARLPPPLQHIIHALQQLPTPILSDEQLVWSHATLPSHAIPVSMLTVRHASTILMQPVVERRMQRWLDFLVEACDVGSRAQVAPAVVSRLNCLFKKLWKLGWHNERKVIFWRLSVNGLPFSSRFHTGKSCVCSAVGAANPDRLHHFWHCEAAQAVIGEMQRGLLLSGNVSLERRHVWLMEVPAEVEQRYNSSVAVRQLWRIVCLAALNAMWQYAGRAMNATQSVRDAWREAGGHGEGGLIAVTSFRGMLEEFARVGSPPTSWEHALPVDAPFFRFSADHTLHVIPMQ